MTVYKWSTTASSNDTADSTVNWREAQAPSTVNDSARAMMAAIAKWRDDQSGNLVTAGTSTAYTLTTNQVYTALTDGISVTCRIDEVSGASPTLNVDSLGAKSIASVYGTAIPTAALKAGGVYTFTYDSTDDKWIVHGNPSRDVPSGSVMLFYSATAPAGWTVSNSYQDYAIRVVTGTSNSGGAAVGGTEFSTIFVNRTDVAPHAHTYSGTTGLISVVHTHTVTNRMFTGAVGGGSATGVLVDSSTNQSNTAQTNPPTSSSESDDHTHTYSGTTASTGTGMDFAVQYISVIAASKD